MADDLAVKWRIYGGCFGGCRARSAISAIKPNPLRDWVFMAGSKWRIRTGSAAKWRKYGGNSGSRFAVDLLLAFWFGCLCLLLPLSFTLVLLTLSLW